MAILYYIHDPMCSWCWGFKPVWHKLQKSLASNIKVRYLLGGLAQDSDIPMPLQLQSSLQQTWHRIQNEIPGINFNFDFWINNIPYRSTYPACRAVIAARKQDPSMHKKMIDKIQQAYYLEAQNVSDFSVLTQCAKELNLNVDQFIHDSSSTETQNILSQEINFSRELGAQGFPSLVLNFSDKDYFIEVDYTNENNILTNINRILNPI